MASAAVAKLLKPHVPLIAFRYGVRNGKATIGNDDRRCRCLSRVAVPLIHDGALSIVAR